MSKQWLTGKKSSFTGVWSATRQEMVIPYEMLPSFPENSNLFAKQSGLSSDSKYEINHMQDLL